MSKLKQFIILALPFAALVLPACSKKSSGNSHPELGHFQEYAKSTLAQAKKNDWSGYCYDEDLAIMLALTAKIDQHETDIRAYVTRSRASKQKTNGETVGDLFIRKNGVSAHGTEWESEAMSWRSVSAASSKVVSPKDWARIGANVDRLLLEDNSRLGYGDNYAVTPTNFHSFEDAYKIVDECMKTKTCSIGLFSEAIRTAISEYWWFKRLLERIENNEAKAKSLERLQTELKFTAERFYLKPYQSAKRISESAIEIPMDAGPLNSAKIRLAEIFEKAWKSDALSVKIRWTSRAQEPGAYLIVFDPTKVFDARVDWENRLIRLSAAVSENTLTHEFGHVLGFADHYYTPYYYEECTYKFWSKTIDVMSDHDGKVTAAEWDTLNRAYPFNGKVGTEKVPNQAP